MSIIYGDFEQLDLIAKQGSFLMVQSKLRINQTINRIRLFKMYVELSITVTD